MWLNVKVVLPDALVLIGIALASLRSDHGLLATSFALFDP